MTAVCPKEQERKLRRALSNRKSAKKSRQKKKEMINNLSVNYKNMCILNDKMEEEITRLRRRVQELEQQLGQSSSSGTTMSSTTDPSFVPVTSSMDQASTVSVCSAPEFPMTPPEQTSSPTAVANPLAAVVQLDTVNYQTEQGAPTSPIPAILPSPQSPTQHTEEEITEDAHMALSCDEHQILMSLFEEDINNGGVLSDSGIMGPASMEPPRSCGVPDSDASSSSSSSSSEMGFIEEEGEENEIPSFVPAARTVSPPFMLATSA